nr:MAG TPA: hypothetical protein [Caudoviricetes sp.]
MSKKVSKEEIKEVVETSEEVVDKAVETAEQTVESVTEVTPVVVEEKGFWETTAEIAAHARPIIKKIVIGGALVGFAMLGFKALSKPAEEEVIATEDQSDDTILEGEFTTNEE